MSDTTLMDAVAAWDAKQNEEQENKATMAARFVNSNLSSKYIFKDGSEGVFIGGELLTTNPVQFLELMSEIKLGHPTIKQEVGKEFVDTRYVDPMEEVKRKAVEEYKASVARATSGELDAGESEVERLKGIANSANVASAFGVSSSGASEVGAGTTDTNGTVVATTNTANTAKAANPALAALAAKAAASKAST